MMGITRLMFGVMYRIGYTPWDGHALPARFSEVAAKSGGRALDIGCGTGSVSLLLAKHGWDVTSVDLVDVALDRARAKAKAAGAKIRFVRADATRLRDFDVGEGFDLIVDMGCLHGMSDAQRDAYVPQIKALAAPKASYFVVAFTPGSSPPRGMDRAEMVRRFEKDWTLVGDGDAPTEAAQNRSARFYEHTLR